MTPSLSAYALPVVMLVGSNLFMTAAWYGHLRYPSTALWIVVMASWGIAFFEYCLQVPANRWGHVVYSAPQLKGTSEVAARAGAGCPRLAAFVISTIAFVGAA